MNYKKLISNKEIESNSKIYILNKYYDEEKFNIKNKINYKISITNKKISKLNKIREKEITNSKNTNKIDLIKVEKQISKINNDYDKKIRNIDTLHNNKLSIYIEEKKEKLKSFRLSVDKEILKIKDIFKKYKQKLITLESENKVWDKSNKEKIISKINSKMIILNKQTSNTEKLWDSNQITKKSYDRKKENINNKINKLNLLKEQKLSNKFNSNVRKLNFNFKVLLNKTKYGEVQRNKWSKKFVNNNKILIVVLLFAMIPATMDTNFLSSGNILGNILGNNSAWGVLALGMTFVILTGGIDLSIGSMLALVGYGTITMISQGQSIALSVIVGIIFAMALGAVQGILIGKFKLPPFIVTLVGMLSFRGIVRIWADGTPVTVNNDKLFNFSIGKFLGIPNHFWILIVVLVVLSFILKFTKLGRHTYAVGSNEDAAKLSGIKTNKIILFAYIIMGITVAISAGLYISSVQQISPTFAEGKELDAIAAVVLGGTTLKGGKGSVFKTFIGWIVISTLDNALVTMGIQSDWKILAKGLVILMTVLFDKDLKLVSRISKIVENLKSKFINKEVK